MRAAWTWANALGLPLVLAALGAWLLLAPSRVEVSELEARTLAAWPELTMQSLEGGRYTRDVEMYIADHFPGRERFVALQFAVRAHLGVHGDTEFYASKGGALGGLEAHDDWQRSRPVNLADAAVVVDELLVEEDAGAPGDDGGADAGDGDGGELPAVEAPAVAEAQPPADLALPADEADAGPLDGPATVRDGVLIANGRGMMLLSATDDTAKAFADVLNLYGAALPQAAVYAVMVPGAGAFYLPPSQRSRSVDERENLEAIRSRLSPAVHWVDVTSELAAHASEDIYYRTDHHWTGLGAYYGYRAIGAAAGFDPLPLDAFEWKTRPQPTLGSLYRMTNDRGLRETPDVTRYFVPPVEYRAVTYAGADYDVPVRSTFIDEHAQGYLVYLGGDQAVMGAKTNVKNGRRALLVKNSFGNPLASLLLPHFEQVIVVDYRFYWRTIVGLAKRYKVTDVFVQNATLTANDPYHRGRLRMALWTPVYWGDGGVPEPGHSKH